nr:isoform 2 of dipeptidyl peptidase 3 [Quercus suber]
MIGIADADEIKSLRSLVDSSSTFIRQLPWAVEGVNDGKGPFEKSLFEAPDFASGSLIPADSLQYDYIRESCGFKNIVLANRLDVNNNPNLPYHWLDPPEVEIHKRSAHIVRFLTTAIHELLGHGTSKLLSETSPGEYNFNQHEPPTNPLTGEPILTYYLPGQTWGSVFGKLADALTIGVNGVQALEHFNPQDQAWGQVHHQHGDGVVAISHDHDYDALKVHVDKAKILTHGKPALGHYLCKLHIWRCTADVVACKELYEPLCAVDGVYEEWRKIVVPKPNMRCKFVQPNTFLRGETVEVKVYEETNEGTLPLHPEVAGLFINAIYFIVGCRWILCQGLRQFEKTTCVLGRHRHGVAFCDLKIIVKVFSETAVNRSNLPYNGSKCPSQAQNSGHLHCSLDFTLV